MCGGVWAPSFLGASCTEVCVVGCGRYPSQWLHSEAANRLFQHAKFRIYRALPTKKPTTKGAKGKDKAAGSSSGSGGTEGNMEEEGKEAGEEKGGAEKGGGDLTLRVVLEENPKWRLLKEVLQEVREEASKGKPLHQDIN